MKKLFCVGVAVLFCIALCGCQAEPPEKIAAEVWEDFLAYGKYETHTGNYMLKHGEQGLEYTIADLNADGTEELLIQTAEHPFTNTWVFVWDGADIHLAIEKYGYGSFGYSPDRNLVKGTPDFKPFKGTGYAPFYRLSGTKMEYAFQVGQDEGQYYYSDTVEKKTITADEQAAYLTNTLYFEWTPLPLSNTDKTQ